MENWDTSPSVPISLTPDCTRLWDRTFDSSRTGRSSFRIRGRMSLNTPAKGLVTLVPKKVPPQPKGWENTTRNLDAGLFACFGW